MVIDELILQACEDYTLIGTLYQRLLTSMAGSAIAVPTFASVFARVSELIRTDQLEHKYVWLPQGGRYVLCRRNRRW